MQAWIKLTFPILLWIRWIRTLSSHWKSEREYYFKVRQTIPNQYLNIREINMRAFTEHIFSLHWDVAEIWNKKQINKYRKSHELIFSYPVIYFYHSCAHTLTICDTNSTDSFCILFLQIDGLNAGIFGWEITIHIYVHTYIRPFITMWQDSRMDFEWNFLSRSFSPPQKNLFSFLSELDTLS